VQESRRRVTYAVRVEDAIVSREEIDEIATRMRERLDARGEVSAEVVVVQGSAQETLRLFGSPYSVSLVRAAMFNAAISWRPLEPFASP
jgi:hypothetical protein